MNIYLAGPLFSIAEQEFNIKIAAIIEKELKGSTVVLPQVYASQHLGDPNFTTIVFNWCLDMVKNSDVIVAMLEGEDADSGTCIELGFGHALNKKIIGVRTDFRSSEDRGLNLMVSNVCNELIWDTKTKNSEQLALQIISAIKSLN